MKSLMQPNNSSKAKESAFLSLSDILVTSSLLNFVLRTPPAELCWATFKNIRQGKWERECMCECVCVCVKWERECMCERERVWKGERTKDEKRRIRSCFLFEWDVQLTYYAGIPTQK